MPAALMTGDQRAISPSICARNYAGLEPTGSINCVASFSFTAGDMMMAMTSLLLASTIPGGVPPG